MAFSAFEAADACLPVCIHVVSHDLVLRNTLNKVGLTVEINLRFQNTSA